MIVIDKLIRLTRRLYPKGRSFNMIVGSLLERVHRGLARSERRIHNDSLSVLDTILPDNDNFTTTDATRWEERLGMITNPNVSLANRKLAIRRKLNHPGTIPARQSIDYIQDQLQAAGFDVFCYRSNGLSPYQILYNLGEVAQLGDVQMGDVQMGDVYTFYNVWNALQLGDAQLGQSQLNTFNFSNAVMNTIPDELVTFVSGYPWVFYIGGSPIGVNANVPIERKEEFRQLILKLKPVNSVAYLFINYN